MISVTRARARSIWVVPPFAIAASAALRQAQRAAGFLGGSLLQDRLTFWTMTAWTGEEAMAAYVTSGAHRTAMPRVAHWCDEASVVRWSQADDALPTWSIADRRMRLEGRPLALSKPSSDHKAMSFGPTHASGGAPIFPSAEGFANDLRPMAPANGYASKEDDDF